MSIKKSLLAVLGIVYSLAVVADTGVPYRELDAQWRAKWEALLHYEGARSVIDPSSDFFLSPQGAFHPDKELAATIDYFKSDPVHACEFPARAYLITGQKPNKSCSAYQEFEQYVALDSVSLVFASESETSPVSSMGHVFLLLGGVNQQGVFKQHATAFVADTAQNKNLLMDFLHDRMSGSYVLIPYDDWIYQYVSLEQRSLWEYELALSDEARQWLRWHLFELKEHPIKYSFFKHNCANGLSQVLTAADPSLSVAHTGVYLTPVQYTQWMAQKGTVKKLTLRPSSEDAQRVKRGNRPDPLKTPAASRWQVSANYRSGEEAGLGFSFLPFFTDLKEINPAHAKLTEVKFFELDARVFQHHQWIEQITLVNIRSLPNLALSRPKLNLGFELHGTQGNKSTSLRPDIHIGTGFSLREKGIRPFWSVDAGVYLSPIGTQYYALQRLGIYYTKDPIKLELYRQDSVSQKGDYANSPRSYHANFSYAITPQVSAFARASCVKLTDSRMSEVSVGLNHRF